MKKRIQSSIAELKNILYRRNYNNKKQSVRPEFYSRRPEVQKTWNTKDAEISSESTLDSPNVSKSNMFKKLFIFSVIFFVGALGVASVLFFSGENIVSSDNVDINVLGPVSVAGGDELSLQISITNNNNTDLKYTDLLVEYPDGAREASDASKDLKRSRESLGVIKSGGNVNKIIRTVMYGQEGSSKVIKITVEYRVDGSNAIFVKSKIYKSLFI